MKPDHAEIIEAMARAAFARVTKYTRRDMESAVRAAAQQGLVLARLPSRIATLAEVPPHVQEEPMGSCRGAYRQGWKDCLAAIETIDLEESE